MEIIRNLSGVQKGLLAGLALGIMAVYFCLCLSAVGIIPVSLPGLSGPVAQVPTDTSVPPTATAMSNIPTEEPSPTAISETKDEATETSVPAVEVVATAAVVEVVTTAEPETSPEVVASEPEPETDVDTLAVLKVNTPVRVEIGETAEAGAKVASANPEVITETAGSDMIAVSLDEATEEPVSAATSVIVLLPDRSPEATPEWIWQGIEVERLPGSETGTQMGVLAVRVFGVPDREVYVQEVSSGLTATLVTGRVPLYGDFSDDVGSLPAATYLVRPQGIDAEVEVTLEEGDFVLIEFALRPPPGWSPEPAPDMTVVPVTQGTPVVQKTDTAASPESGWTWQGIVYEHKENTGDPASIIAVRVVDVPDRKVFVKEDSGTWETTLVTGRKPEYGKFSDDVGGLGPGTYTVKPTDIDSEVTVTLERGDFVLVEFALRPAPDWTPGSATAVPTVPATLGAQPVQPAQPTSVQVPSGIVADPAATESAKAGWTWQGVVYEHRENTGDPVGIIAVRVVDVPDRKVFVEGNSGTWETTLVTGRKPEYGKFSDDVGGLGPGTYTIKPMDIDSEVTVTLERGDSVLVEFALRPVPGWTPGSATAVPTALATLGAQPVQPAQPTSVQVPSGIVADPAATESAKAGWTWQGVVYEHRENTGDPVGIIAVRVVDVPDRKVFVEGNSGTWETTLVTGRKPEYGKFSDDVGGLGPGTYTIKPMDIDSEVTVTLERGDSVLVEFALRPVPGWTPDSATDEPVTLATPAPQPVQPAQPTQVTVPVAPTQETGWTWQGIEYERKSGMETGNAAGVIAVRVVGVPDRKVFVREVSGGWETTLVTGNKPEYGDFADSVGSLSPGTYVVKPMDIDSEVSVNLETGDFVLVEFALWPARDWTPGQPAVAQGMPTPTLVPGWTWQGREVDRKPGVQTGTASATLVVRGIALPDWQVVIRNMSGIWTRSTRLERHAQYGNFAGVVEGLSAGTYTVELDDDVGTPAQVTIGQGDFVLLEFFPSPAQ